MALILCYTTNTFDSHVSRIIKGGSFVDCRQVSIWYLITLYSPETNHGLLVSRRRYEYIVESEVKKKSDWPCLVQWSYSPYDNLFLSSEQGGKKMLCPIFFISDFILYIDGRILHRYTYLCYTVTDTCSIIDRTHNGPPRPMMLSYVHTYL